jgi:hypothetical protein
MFFKVAFTAGTDRIFSHRKGPGIKIKEGIALVTVIFINGHYIS